MRTTTPTVLVISGSLVLKMITAIEIENYKPLNKLTLEVRRFHIFIGENGCGKSNILEAITFTAHA